MWDNTLELLSKEIEGIFSRFLRTTYQITDFSALCEGVQNGLKNALGGGL